MAVLALAIPGGAGFVWIALLFSCGMGGWTCFSQTHELTVRKREEVRVQRFETWLAAPWPELAEQEPWCEIERAVGALLSEGVDPTYERAKDFLRRERKMEQKRWCSHGHIERFVVDDGHSKQICIDCGELVSDTRALLNPFRRLSEPRDLDDVERALVQQRKKILAAYAVPPVIFGPDDGSVPRFD